METVTLHGPRTELRLQLSEPATLAYRDERHDAFFDDVALTRNELGTLATVVLHDVPGSHTTTLTIAIPDHRFPPGETRLTMTTFAVLTLHRADTQPEPITGALARYNVIQLHGTVRSEA
jgi:hypothetical protein